MDIRLVEASCGVGRWMYPLISANHGLSSHQKRVNLIQRDLRRREEDVEKT